MEPAESLSCLVCVFAYLINLSETTQLIYTIPESQPTNTLIGNIAIDGNLRSMVSEENFRNLEFFFLTLDEKYIKHVEIDSQTSNLTVKEPMDREVICAFSPLSICSFQFEVAAKSSIDTSFIKVTVTLQLEDINDNAPKFSNSFLQLTVSEADVIGKSIEIDGATDLDSANFSVKSYELSPTNVPFMIEYDNTDDGSSLNLVISEPLDREKVNRYSFDLIAFDGGDPPLDGSMTIDVTVEDANDNRPIFIPTSYNITVKESFPLNTTFLTVTATDLDIGNNGEISFRISKQQSTEIQNTFAITTATGELYLIDHLVYKSEAAIQVKVEAVDNGARPMSATAVVSVTVEDSVNVMPQIALNLLSQSDTAVATEYASVGTVVAYVKVTDNDGGRNGQVECNINSPYFGTQVMEAKEYKVVVITPLDRETMDTHNVTVVCRDNGVPRLSASAHFSVVVTDENDNAPVFDQNSYVAAISENNVDNSTVIQVHAKDADIGKNGLVSYYVNPEYRTNFSINAKTGLVQANIKFDRETKASYDLIVTAVDAGNPPMSSNVSIRVIIKDENDNEPVFKKQLYEYFTPESNLEEIVLGKVLAEDKDDGGNGNVTYSLVGNYSELPFEVLPDGTVKSTKKLDREEFDKYHFQIMAIDNGVDIRRSTIVNVTVYVTDINDNAPIIVFPKDVTYIKYITYMTPAGTQIMKIEARDDDDGKNAELTYTVYGRNDSNKFEVGKNGEIIVTRKLTEDDINQYYLDVVVADQGLQPKSVTTRVNIEVLAKNLTAISESTAAIDQQHVVIAVVVVVVTLVIAAAILILIWVIRRHDLQKRKYMNGHDNQTYENAENDSGFSSNADGKPTDTMKVYKSSLLPSTYPVVPSAPIDMEREVKQKDVKFQETVHVREKSADSTAESTNQKTVELHRLASLRLHQAFIQNHDRQWATSQSELNQDGSKEGRKQEDIHSDMSADTATYDSGIGGSVSDTGDCRLSQLQNLVRQSGRRGKPPHVQPNHQTKGPKIIARGHSCASDIPPERPPPLKMNPYKITSRSPMQNGTKSPVRSPVHFSPPVSPLHFSTSSPTPCSVNQNKFMTPSISPTKMTLDRGYNQTRHSPSISVVQDLLMYKKFQNGLRPPNGHIPIDESIDTTQFEDDGSSTSGSYYIDNPEDWRHAPVSDIYV